MIPLSIYQLNGILIYNNNHTNNNNNKFISTLLLRFAVQPSQTLVHHFTSAREYFCFHMSMMSSTNSKQIDQILLENEGFLKAIQEFQAMGKVSEVME